MSHLQSFYQIEIVPIPMLSNEEWMVFPSIFTYLPLYPFLALEYCYLLRIKVSKEKEIGRELACRQDALSVLIIISGHVGISLVLVDFFFCCFFVLRATLRRIKV